MRLKWLGVIFPLGVVGLMAIERLSTFLLGSYPSSENLWAISLELKSVFAYSARWLDGASGGLLSVQLALLLLTGFALTAMMATRRWTAVSFMVNHALLIFMGTAALMTTGGTVASASGALSTPSSLFVAGSLNLEMPHYLLLALGLLGCVACHYNFLRQSFARQHAVTLAMRELALNLEGRRAAR